MSQRATHNHDVRVLILLLASAGVIVLGCLVLNGFTWARLQNSAGQQSMALDRLAQYSRLLSTLQDVELGQRGYVISGNEYHLEIFGAARGRFSDEWEQLVFLETMDGRSKQDLKEIREKSEELIRFANEIVFLRQNQGYLAADKVFNQVKQRTAMRGIRTLYLKRMEEVEMTIRARSRTAEGDFQAGLATSMAMGMLAIGIGAISLLLLRRVLKEISRSERYAVSMVKAEEARRQKDVFLAMMSHEIRTPLNAIIGFGQLAQQEEMGGKAKRYVNSILDGGQSLLLLINDILDLSKLQAGKMELKLEPTRLNELLLFLERLFQETCMTKGIGFELVVQEDLPEALVLDSLRLRQVLMNLIGNAVKFTERGKVTVDVSGKTESAETITWNLEIRVRDTGPGISKDDLSHIFEPFYQSNDSPEPVSKGTGLGLSIVHRFVKLMNGEITVESSEGQGTTFTVRLKNLSASVIARVLIDQGAASQPVDFNRLKPSRILAVDDNAINRDLLMEIFSGTHHEVITACDGEEAVRVIREAMPDLVLMDLRMPVMDGSAAAKAIKMDATFRGVPIIAVTAGSLPNKGLGEQLAADFDGALRKPFTRKEIFDALSLFITRAVEQDAEKPVSSVSETVGEELLAELKRILIEQWPSVKAGMTISEITGFAEELADLAGESNCSRMEDYARDLTEAADSFSFGEMETLLGRYPDLVAELEESRP